MNWYKREKSEQSISILRETKDTIHFWKTDLFVAGVERKIFPGTRLEMSISQFLFGENLRHRIKKRADVTDKQNSIM